MTVLICNDTPPSIRGHLKRWFIEPKANVFVGTLNTRTHKKVMEYILRNAPKEFGVLAITSAPNCQGYEIDTKGTMKESNKNLSNVTGISLISESSFDGADYPF